MIAGPSQPILPPPDCITPSHVSARIQSLLETTLLGWQPQDIVMLSTQLVNHIVSLSRNGYLGPKGLLSVKDIFMTIGHQGPKRYMALALNAPDGMRVLLRGDASDVGIGDLVYDVVEGRMGTARLEWLRQAFHNAALNEWIRVREAMERSVRGM
jgi:hypothetical protein